MPTIDLLQSNNVVSAFAMDRIKQSNVTVNPFQVNKTWVTTSGSNDINVSLLYAVYSNTIPPIGSNITWNDAVNTDGTYQVSIYHSVNHLFYKRKTEPYNCFGQTDINRTHKYLFQSASVFSIPQDVIGEGIKPGSVEILFGTVTASADIYGNLYDPTYNTASIVSGVEFYEGFNEYFDSSRIPYTATGVTYVPGITTTTGATAAVGLCAKFDGAGYIETSLPGQYTRYTDYAVSVFVSASNSDTDSKLILAKAGDASTVAFPFKLELSGSNQLIATVAGASNMYTQVTSSAAITDWTHVVCQKTGSTWQLYVDGALDAETDSSMLIAEPLTAATASVLINNNDSVKIGGYNANSSNLTGYIDEVRIFNHALTSANISALTDRTEETMGFIQTNHVGNVFEQQGLAVISSINYLYHDTITDWSVTHQSTVSMYELNVLVQTNRGSFNITQNPTALQDNAETIRTALTGSEFQPYITTIGLYNDRNELVAVGKLAQPIQKREDIDVNFLVRIDLDKNVPGFL